METENSIFEIFFLNPFRELRTWRPNFISSFQRLFYDVGRYLRNVVVESDGPCRSILTLATAQSELGLPAFKQNYTSFYPC